MSIFCVSTFMEHAKKMCYPSLAQLFIFVVFSAQQQSPPPVWLQFTTYAKWQHFWWWQLEAEIANLQPYYMRKYYPSLVSAETILYHPFVESHDVHININAWIDHLCKLPLLLLSWLTSCQTRLHSRLIHPRLTVAKVWTYFNLRRH